MEKIEGNVKERLFCFKETGGEIQEARLQEWEGVEDLYRGSWKSTIDFHGQLSSTQTLYKITLQEPLPNHWNRAFPANSFKGSELQSHRLMLLRFIDDTDK